MSALDTCDYDWTQCRNKNFDNILHIAVRYKHIKILRILFERCETKMHINVGNKTGKTPLHEATQICSTDITNYLLLQGADANALTSNGWTPLMLASSKLNPQNLELVTLLIQHKADPFIQNKDGWTALHIACRNGDVKLVNFFITSFSDLVLVKSKNGRYFLRQAGHLVSELQSMCVVSCDQLKCLNTAVSVTHYHYRRGYEACNSPTFFQRLHLASSRVVLRLAILSSLKTILKDARPLYGHRTIVELLLKAQHGIVSASDFCGASPIHEAARSNSCDIIKILIDKGASIYDVDLMGLNCLHMAAQAGAISVVQFLVSTYQMDTNIKNCFNNFTPLHYASQAGQYDTIRELLKLGANSKSVDHKGRLRK
ncbi:hypothetical protein L9F63_023756 [Diploptera punctata]|uniref:Ankyrin repeat domain-containing protein 16 n=1 Tax=Diploptera punctata TaxID=6984 RepID=A0AAD7ZIG7_DIPPU|nr:hypothetical protein L9F63_023756 [Diploptera punctata]